VGPALVDTATEAIWSLAEDAPSFWAKDASSVGTSGTSRTMATIQNPEEYAGEKGRCRPQGVRER
jgi:hypothetical protein